MKNYIVVHYLNGRLLGRWDFGKNSSFAKDHAEFIANSVYQTGHHLILAIEEHNPSEKLYLASFNLMEEP